MENPTTEKYDRRAMLALIALAELPMPNEIMFHSDDEILSLEFDRLAEGIAWSSFLGGQTRTYENRDGRRYLDAGLMRWHGWLIGVHAWDPIEAPETSLSPEVTERLTALVPSAS